MLLLLTACCVQAQERRQRGVGASSVPGAADANAKENADTSATKGLVYNVEIPDSVMRRKVFFFEYNPTGTKIDRLWSPYLNPTGAQFNDPLDAFNGNYYLGKGVVGHPHLALYPIPDKELTYSLQPDENAAYAKRTDNIRHYQVLTPYTRLSYGSSLKKDYTLNLVHSQNILPGWNVAADYRLICPEGIFANSDAKNHYLDFSTNYFSRDSRLQAALGLIMESYSIGENGGLQNDSLFTSGTITNFAGLPMMISDSLARHERRNVYGKVTYRLVDSLHLTRPHVINAGVFGVEAGYYHQERWFNQTDVFSHQHATLFWTNDAYADHRWRNPLKVTLGVKQHHFEGSVGNDALATENRYNPFARFEATLGHSSLTGEGEIGKEEHRFAAAYALSFDSAQHSRIMLGTTLEQMPHDLRMAHDATFNLKPRKAERFEFSFIHNPSSHDDQELPMIDLNLRASHLTGHCWYDTTLAVHQGATDFWLYQASLTMRLAWRWLHLDMQQLLQYSTDSIQMAVPTLASKNSLYVDFVPIKNALRMQMGCDLRYHTAFHADAYDPHTGLFLRQTDVKVGDYLWADFFINLQVKRASIYLKAGHFNAIWERQPSYLLLPHYPGNKFALAWGLTWHFFD